MGCTTCSQGHSPSHPCADCHRASAALPATLYPPCIPLSLVSIFFKTSSRSLPLALHIAAQVLRFAERSQAGVSSAPPFSPGEHSEPATCIAHHRAGPTHRGPTAAWCLHCAFLHTVWAAGVCRHHCSCSPRSCPSWSSRTLVPALRIVTPCFCFLAAETCRSCLVPSLCGHAIRGAACIVQYRPCTPLPWGSLFRLKAACFVHCPLHSSLLGK